MTIEGKTILVTGANRGIGRALALEALDRGARRVFAGSRSGTVDFDDERLTVVRLDVTDSQKVAEAAAQISELDLLVNNAGLGLFDDLSSNEVIQRHLDVNLFGLLNVSRSFRPQLAKSFGSILNVLSLATLAPPPMMAGYAVSKAAAFSATQTLRVLFGRDGISVHAGFLGPIDTDMARDVPFPKASAQDAAMGLFDGLDRGEEEIFPDVMAQPLADGWRAGVPKAFEKEFATFAAGAGA